VDIVSKEKRSYIMSRIRSKNTKPELLLRSALFKSGLRYRLHTKNLPGKPDMVFAQYKTVIFVHGCFWHIHKKCRDGRFPKSKLEYWKPKLKRNAKRDLTHEKELIAAGWDVLVIWECEINSNLSAVTKKIQSVLKEKKV